MLIIFILRPRFTEWPLSEMLLLVIADGKETMENLELATELVHVREVTHTLSICMSLVKTSNMTKHDINKVVKSPFPQGGAL